MTKEQWRAIELHDPSYDGKLFCGIKSSKIICRPSCTARKYEPKDIIIFNSLEDAVNAGFHPCSRCRPNLPEWHGAKQELASKAEAYICEHYFEKFSLDSISAALYVDKIYLSKTFKKVTGTTLLKYHNQKRCEEACKLLMSTDLSIEIIADRVGYATPSHFARIFKSIYISSPSAYRKQYLKSLKD
ncbi:MAG: methylphosphotriester-DNA--protein-cysteine methyltransferase family protein [Clostridia bacterium]|nr:methylphosphotriester-DNA--protein-cysteine methyltransferase family protein [Clostridia bacterium]